MMSKRKSKRSADLVFYPCKPQTMKPALPPTYTPTLAPLNTHEASVINLQ